MGVASELQYMKLSLVSRKTYEPIRNIYENINQYEISKKEMFLHLHEQKRGAPIPVYRSIHNKSTREQTWLRCKNDEVDYRYYNILADN